MNIGDGQLDGAASPLGNRYTVVRELGEQNGQTYLAKDSDRYDELCVVKSFLPPVSDASTLEEAKSLFEQEADVLYQLDHPQIPEFRQLLEVPALSGAGGQLFLVQDYAQGPTYQSLLQDRQQVGGRFHEVEINQLLYQLLPVLSYIHNQGLVHRDICPANIVLRQTDGLPVLIDFGSVKALVASVRSRLGMEGVAEIGKAGYIPPDQIGNSHADQTSDLYGLAATLLVLATGEEPQQLYDKEQQTWRGYETLSPKLGSVLLRMLSPNEAERFPSADAVLEALRTEETAIQTDVQTDLQPAIAPDPNEVTAFASDGTMYDGAVPVGLAGGVGAAAGAIAAGLTDATGYEGAEGFSPEGYGPEGYGPEGYGPEGYGPEGPIINEGVMDSAGPMSPIIPMAASSTSAAGEAETYEPELDGGERMTARDGDQQALLGLLALLGLTGLLLLFAIPRLNWSPFGNRSLQGDASNSNNQGRVNQVRVLADGEYSPEEQARKQEITLRREELGLSEETFTGIVNQFFYQEYPALLTSGPNGGRQVLTTAAADEPLRIRWDHTALELIDTLERNFSSQGLNSVGTYTENSREQWRSRISPTGIPERAKTDLVDAKFFRLFPSQAGRDFLSQPIGQLYYALADDRARAIESGSITDNVRFGAGDFSKDVRGRLDPGEGRIYTLALSNGQLLRLNLSAPDESTLLSLYPPTSTDSNPAVFSDSEQTTWSGALNESGTYSVVVINRSSASIDYTLATSVDNVTSQPAPAAKPETADAETTESKTSEDAAENVIDLSEPPVAPPREEGGSEETTE